MIANIITFLRILLIPLIIGLLLSNQVYWAFALFLLAALSDWLDGYLARRLKQVSDFGKFLDPLADKILVISILVVLMIEPRHGVAVPTIIIVGREFGVSVLRIWKAKQGNIMPASRLAKIKTVVQLIAVGMLILSIPYATAVLWLAVLVSIVSGIEYAKK
ncbi:MAG: CDP-diacylglycerol--glycerol-3-phosphate 3-phosphatidyltransferase [Candidatus Saganbacteria bacterium]|nr:CDP-diacylglycerol--glycerol-3-phosphate 3-phosphatidyltransferase [Candidatus Saganbacteria bacterium]